MPENFRAVVAVLFFAIPVLLWLRPQLTAAAIEPADYKLRAGLWIVLTAALFVTQSFWLFMLIVAVALLTVGRYDSNPLGLYFFLLFLAPPFKSAVQGFAGINYFIDVNYLRVLSVAILLPAAIRFARDPDCPGFFKMPTDKYVLAYVALTLAIQYQVTTTTDIMRGMLSHTIDILLPYYAFSRGLVHVHKMRDALAAFTAACSLMAVIALFEAAKGWLLYAMLPDVMDVRWSFGGYMFRDGALRATVSTGHSIVLGYVLMVAFGFHLALRSAYASTRAWTGVLLLIGAGIVASFSRGPWVGLAALIVVAVALSPRAGSNFMKLSLASVLVVPAILLTPFGAKLVALLPFIGTVDEGSVDYRQQLFDVSWDVLMLNPLLGSPHYMMNAAMEQLRQGEGIIDMVNSYMGVAMFSGFIGLALFLGAFVSSGVRLFRMIVRDRGGEGGHDGLALALFTTLIGVLVAIATLSSINVVPVVYWCLAGACAAYLHAEQTGREAASWHGQEPRADMSPEPVR